MYHNTGAKTQKWTAIILVIMLVCVMLSAQAETITTDMLFGTVTGDTFENVFIGLGCTLEGWHYYTDAEMEEVNQKTKDVLSDELADAVDQTIFIMMTGSPDGRQNVNIQLQNVKEYASVYSSMELQDMATASLDGFKATLESAGFTDIQLSVGEQIIGDQTYTCISGEYKISGVLVYFKQMWAFRDIYLITATATTLLEDTTDEVFSHFFVI